jgi:hypothetical protein
MKGTFWKRLGAASGLLYIVLTFVASGDNNSPDYNATPQEITAWAKSVQLTPSFWISPYVHLIGVLFFLVFVAYLWSVLSRAEGEFGWLSATVFASGIATVVVKLVGYPAAAAAVAGASSGFNPQVLGILWDMDNILLFLTLATQAFLLAAAAIVILRAKALPGWLGWSAAIIALALLGMLPLAFFNSIPVQLLPMAWVLVASIVMMIRAGKPVAYLQSSTMQRSEAQPVGVE